MTTINPADIKVGDRIRYSREGVVLAVLPNNKRVRLEVPYANGNGSTVFNLETDLVTTEFELLERPLPAEPPEGSIVIFHHESGPEAWKRWGDHLGWLHAGNSTPPTRTRDGRQGLTWQQLLEGPSRHVERTVITP